MEKDLLVERMVHVSLYLKKVIAGQTTLQPQLFQQNTFCPKKGNGCTIVTTCTLNIRIYISVT